MSLNDDDTKFLRQAIGLAREALEAGDQPFGSVLVDKSGKVLQSERNRVVTNRDATYHPELKLAQWAQRNIRDPAEREATTVYTSGEHCAMCSAAHAWCGLGRIVYASSSKQLGEWMGQLGIKPHHIAGLSIQEVAPGIKVVGPASDELVNEVKDLHVQKAKRELETEEEKNKREGEAKAEKAERARRLREGIGMVEM